MQPELDEKRFGMVPAQRVEAFYLAYHKYLRDNGVDGVKVRLQSYIRMRELSLFFTDHERDFSCSGRWRRAGQLGYCSMHLLRTQRINLFVMSTLGCFPNRDRVRCKSNSGCADGDPAQGIIKHPDRYRAFFRLHGMIVSSCLLFGTVDTVAVDAPWWTTQLSEIC